MKVAVVNAHYFPNEPGGAERSIRVLVNGLVAAGHDVRVFCLSDRASPEEWIDDVQVTRFARPSIGGTLEKRFPRLRKLWWHLRDQHNRRLARLLHSELKAFQADLLHTNNLPGFSVSVWSVANRLAIPIVHTLRDYYLLCPATTLFRNGKDCGPSRCNACRLLTLARMHACRQVQCVVGNSAYTLQQHTSRGLFADASQQVVYNAYDQVGRHKARSQWLLPGNVTFGFLGRLDPSKGVLELVEAFRKFRRRVQGCKLLIAGTGPSGYVERLTASADGDSICMMGQVKADEFLQSIDINVVPSLWPEPLARSIIEAQAFGVPVLAARTGGTPEVITHGINGWLYDPADPQGLACGLDTAWHARSNYSDLSARSIEKSLHFSLERLRTGYESAYLSAMERFANPTHGCRSPGAIPHTAERMER